MNNPDAPCKFPCERRRPVDGADSELLGGEKKAEAAASLRL